MSIDEKIIETDVIYAETLGTVIDIEPNEVFPMMPLNILRLCADDMIRDQWKKLMFGGSPPTIYSFILQERFDELGLGAYELAETFSLYEGVNDKAAQTLIEQAQENEIDTDIVIENFKAYKESEKRAAASDGDLKQMKIMATIIIADGNYQKYLAVFGQDFIDTIPVSLLFHSVIVHEVTHCWQQITLMDDFASYLRSTKLENMGTPENPGNVWDKDFTGFFARGLFEHVALKEQGNFILGVAKNKHACKEILTSRAPFRWVENLLFV
jgi:hypothetical protein